MVASGRAVSIQAALHGPRFPMRCPMKLARVSNEGLRQRRVTVVRHASGRD